MQSLSTELEKTIEGWGPHAAEALKRSRNKERFRRAVEAAWRTRPEVARFILSHVNAIYVAEDTRPRKGPDKERPWWVFGVYLDDAMARTEVDAWQSVLFTCLRREGFSIDELRFFPAKWDMRARRLFPDDEVACVAGAGEPLRYRDEARALDAVKRAVCLAFEDDEQAWALLSQVRGATVREMADEEAAAGEGRGRRRRARFRLTLYVDDRGEVRRLMDAFGRTVRSKARLVGLPLGSIWVCEAPPSLAGRQTFCRVGASRPLRDGELDGGGEAASVG